jgi:hypothetical protein
VLTIIIDMMSRRRNLNQFFPMIILLGLGVFLAVPAFAYVDPNGTGLVTQIMGPVLVIAAAGLTFLRKQANSAIQWLASRVTRK